MERRAGRPGSPAKRLVAAAVGAAAAGGVMLLVFPKFFLGPYVDYNLALWPISTDITKEVQPLVPTDRASIGSLLLHLGPAFLAVPYLLFQSVRARGANLWSGWLPVALGLAAYVPLSLVMRRFSPYAAVLMAVVIADLAGVLFARLAAARGTARWFAIQGLVAAVLFAPMALAGVLVQGTPAAAGAPVGAPACPLDELIAELKKPEGLGRAPLAVLWSPNHGPQILYETPHAVITTLYPRNAKGQLDAYAIYTATDWDVAHALVAKRGIDLIVTCIQVPTYGARSDAPGMLDTELRRGVFPPWLAPVALGPAASRHFRVYRAVPASP